MISLWKNHSLSVVLISVGIVLLLIAIPFVEGTWFDLLLTIGGGFFTVGLVQVLQGPLTEKNKPEE
jgi:Co/Zn/Cd efflux system component